MEDKKKELLTEFRELIEVKYGDYHKWKEIEPKLSNALDTLLQSKDSEWKEKVKGITPELPGELGTIVDDYDDYVTGFQDAKITLLLEKAVTSSTKKD